MVAVIESVSAEGFRGLNKRSELEFKDGVNLLFGKHGTGKSSVINAISWCITGEFPQAKLTDEFKKEDAIVFLSHPKRTAEVTLALSHDGKKIKITRKRNIAKSTTAGKSTVTLEVTGEPKPVEGEKAEAMIEMMMRTRKSDFSRVYCLHQELLKELLSIKPEERSRVIDRLLGTIEVREFAEALNIKRTVTEKINSLQKEVDAIQRDKIQFAINLKKMVNEKRNALIGSGFTESQLTIEEVAQILAELINEARILATEYGAKILELKEPRPELYEVSLTIKNLESAIREVDRSLTNTITSLQEKKLRLNSILKGYKDAGKDLRAFGTSTLEFFDDSIKELESKTNLASSKLNNLNDIIGNLTTYKASANNSITTIGNIETSIKEAEKKYGNEEDHTKLIHKSEEELESTRRNLSTYSRYQQLINLTLEHLSEIHPNECPICGQPIECQSIIDSLKNRVHVEVQEEINSLRERLTKVQQTTKEIKESLEELKSLRNKLKSEEKTLGELLAKISELIKQEVDVSFNFDDKINELSQKTSELSKEIFSLRGKKEEILLQRGNLEKCLKNFKEIEKQLQTEVKSEKVQGELITEAEEELARINKEISKYESREKIDELIGRISRVKEIHEYLAREEELKGIENQLPHLSKLVEEKEAAKKNLEKFGSSLEAIRKSALEYEGEIVSKDLSSLSEHLNRYYSDIVDHPLFKKIVLDIERAEPLIYSIKATGKVGPTRISTRLSNAQMNATAIALLLANNEKLGSSMPILLMDDPTQSFDSYYKQTLAKKIAELSKERQIIVATQDQEFRGALEKDCSSIRIYEFMDWKEGEPVVRLCKS